MRHTLPLLTCLALGATAPVAPKASAAPSIPQKAKAPASQAAAALSGDERIVHALNRLGFGPRPGDVERVRAQGLGAWIDEQLHPEKIDDAALEASLKNLPLLQAPASTLAVAQEYDTARAIKLLMALRTSQNTNTSSERVQKARAKLKLAANRKAGGKQMTEESAATPEAKAEFAGLPLVQQQRAQEISERAAEAGVEPGDSVRAVGTLAAAKVARAAQSKKQLQEVLVDFWSNHFNLDVRKGSVRTLKVVDEREVIRPRVLGRFRDLLGASAHSPAMLLYLDNVRSSAPQ